MRRAATDGPRPRRRLLALAGLVLCAPAGCQVPLSQVVQAGCAPEVQTLPVRDPAALPPVPVPPIPPPATVADDPAALTDRPLTLNEAVRLTLENARAIRVYTGIGASSSGRTIYDAAIAATVIDQQQARFDPVLTAERTHTRTENPQLTLDPTARSLLGLGGPRVDTDRTAVGLAQTNPLGGQANVGLTRTGNELNNLPTGFLNPTGTNTGQNTTGTGLNTGGAGLGLGGGGLNPEVRPVLEARYTQPLLQGGGFQVNLAPVVIARLDTERSYFQVKEATQELVRGTIEGYWNLVFARLDVWAREIQLEQSEEALRREEARRLAGIGDIRNVAQARVTMNQFRAALIAARANVLAREGALRNVIGLPPSDGTRLVPVSAPATDRFKPEWKALLAFAERRRPDVIELKLVLEADRQRQIQAENAALPRLDATALYRWNGLTGTLPSTGERLSADFGQFTDWTVGVTFSVPLGLREGRARVREQTLIIQRDRANLDQVLHAAGHELAVTVRELENSYEQYLAYRETRAAALTNLMVQVAEQRAGRGIYLSVLQALNDWGSAITSEARSLIDYNVRLAALERQTGTILETHGLVFVEERFRSAGPLCLPGHDRLYPQAQQPAGEPTAYPDSGQPGENAFDLTRPVTRPARLKPPEPADGAELPPPKPAFGAHRWSFGVGWDPGERGASAPRVPAEATAASRTRGADAPRSPEPRPPALVTRPPSRYPGTAASPYSVPLSPMRRLLKWLLVVVVVVSGLAVACFQARQYVKAGVGPRFTTAAASAGKVEAVVNSTGPVKPVQSVSVGSFVSGPILDIYVDFNSVVEKDQLLARIDPRITQAAYDRELATLATQRADLTRIQAQLDQAVANERRALKLQKANPEYLSEQELDQLRYARMALAAQKTVAEANIKVAQASVKNAEANLEYTRILAPVAGVVIDRKVERGQTVASSFQTPELFVIAPDLEKHVYVFASVDEADIGLIRTAQEKCHPVKFTVDAYPEDVFAGAIFQVRKLGTTTQNVVTYPVVIEAPNPELKLLPGMTASVSFQIDVRENVTRLPAAALRYVPADHLIRPEDKPYVEFKARKDPKEGEERLSAERKAEQAKARSKRVVWVADGAKVRAIPVTIGLVDGQYAELVSGDVTPGQDLITGIEGEDDRRARR